MRGDYVIVRAYGGVPLIRRVWDEDEHAVFITNDEQLALLLLGGLALEPIGFPKEDVYKFDEVLAQKMDRLYQSGKWKWANLIPWGN